MMTLTDIKRSGSLMECGYSPDGTEEVGRVVYDVERLEFVEVVRTSLDRDSERYVGRVKYWLCDHMRDHSLPDEVRIGWK